MKASFLDDQTRSLLLRLFASSLLLITGLTCGNAIADTESASDDEIDLSDIVRRPEYGNFRGYAEFKMGHYASAKRIWEALDERNFSEAGFDLGILYEDGLGVTRDIDRALTYYRRSAMLGSPKAMFRLGVLYWLGAPGVPIRRDEGRRFLSMSAAAGDADAQRYMAADKSTAAANDPILRADQALAGGHSDEYIAILKTSAEAGLARAQTRLAWSFEEGKDVERNLALAAEWFSKAAQGGDGEAMYALAVMCSTGAGQTKDPALAEQWLKRSAAAGYPDAISDLKRRQTSK